MRINQTVHIINLFFLWVTLSLGAKLNIFFLLLLFCRSFSSFLLITKTDIYFIHESRCVLCCETCLLFFFFFCFASLKVYMSVCILNVINIHAIIFTIKMYPLSLIDILTNYSDNKMKIKCG